MQSSKQPRLQLGALLVSLSLTAESALDKSVWRADVRDQSGNTSPAEADQRKG